MDLVSIIVPVYNVEEYLPKCLDSILNQTYKNLEIILVDDGSTDGSGVICDDYATKDKRIKVIHKQNGGLSDARNVGIDICTGDYIGFVDSDDYIEIDMYETLLNYLKENNLDVCMCASADVIDGKIINSKKFDAFCVDNKEGIIRETFVNKYGGMSISVCNKLFIKDIFKGIRFLKEKTSEDVFFVLDWIKNTERFGRISDCKYYYVKRNGSITHLKYYDKSILDIVEAYERNFEVINALNLNAVEYGIYRLGWAYKVAIDRIYECIDYNSCYDIIENLQYKIKRNLINLLRNPHNDFKKKIAYIALSIDVDLYFYLKKIKKTLR